MSGTVEKEYTSHSSPPPPHPQFCSSDPELSLVYSKDMLDIPGSVDRRRRGARNRVEIRDEASQADYASGYPVPKFCSLDPDPVSGMPKGHRLNSPGSTDRRRRGERMQVRMRSEVSRADIRSSYLAGSNCLPIPASSVQQQQEGNRRECIHSTLLHSQVQMSPHVVPHC